METLLSRKQLRMFPRIQRKYNVSVQFLRSNMHNIWNFYWYALCPRLVIKRIAIRKQRTQRVFIKHFHLRRVLFDQTQRKSIKIRKRNVQQWSKRMVCYLKNSGGIKEFVESDYEDSRKPDEIEQKDNANGIKMGSEEVTKQLKEQLELLKSGKRTVPLIEGTTEPQQSNASEKPIKEVEEAISTESEEIPSTIRELTDKTDTLEHTAPILVTPEIAESVVTSTEAPPTDSPEKPRCTTNFLDMLMNKVRVRNISNDKTQPAIRSPPEVFHSIDSISPEKKDHIENEQLTDSSEEFLGFEETERPPGMLQTPIVPRRSTMSSVENSAFISESLNEYMRKNLLETSNNTAVDETVSSAISRKHRQANLDGLVTPGCKTPHMDMPLVPESLQKLRTVAERRQYLQKFSKNHKMAIINNEAQIYRELQRKKSQNKPKSVSQQMMQAPSSQLPFTRNGWQAASFLATEFNKYYYQMLDVDSGREYVRLSGVRGNNDERNQKAYVSVVPPHKRVTHCTQGNTCSDLLAWRDFRPIQTVANKTKLNRAPFPALFRPCPLSHKPFQKPLDDETAALLLAGGSMAVVRMPTVELEVFPELGKPLNEIAKRYLQYILPHHDISREWAEFSVSTLSRTSSMRDAEQAVAAATTTTDGLRRSFTFAIPYLNDRNHILVRRVVDRSEKLDQSFEQAPESDAESKSTMTVADLNFRANLDESDTVLMDCADVVSDMINSVAISCSENSFIKEDPHSIRAASKNVETSPKSASKELLPKTSSQIAQTKKQNRLLLELRRLNATIIDANTKAEKDSEPCSKDYCRLGCVCTSITDDYPLRQHCGKSKCVIECTCKGSNQSRIMRLETDGRSITTEDAFMLRRQATARLARMEKEFTSTIVLTENETLLINESQYDKKRRCTKAPKRYEDFADTDDDFTRTSPIKSSSAVVAIDAAEKISSNTTGFSDITTELREPIYIKDTVLDQLKHCTVSLVPFESTKSIAVWCMVHELYKCFCGGRAMEGKPLFIEKEEINSTIANTNSEDELVVPAAKAHYSFETMEEEYKETTSASPTSDEEEEEEEEEEEDDEEYTLPKQYHDGGSNEVNRFTNESQPLSADDETDTELKKPALRKRGRPRLKSIEHMRPHLKSNEHIHPKRGRPSEQDQIQGYFNGQPNLCRRVVPIPRNSYLHKNRRRVPETIDYITEHENDNTRLLLNEHIIRSVYYHKHELEKQRKEEHELQLTRDRSHRKRQKALIDQKKIAMQNEKKQAPVTANKEQLIDEDSRQSTISSSSSSRLSQKSKRLKHQKTNHQGRECEDINNTDYEVLETEAVADHVDLTRNSNDSLLVPMDSGHPLEEDTSDRTQPNDLVQVPKISNCFSLHENNIQEPVLNSSATDVSSATDSNTAAAFGEISISNENFKEFYNNVIKNMNVLVTKRMQDIDQMLKRESKVIPSPNEEILCVIKWSNFLDAYKEELVFIWEVKMRDHCFFAATVTNMMPMILGAMGVVNITAVDVKKLSLMGRMLVEGFRNENTSKLAVVMQGRIKYWLVKGFLRPDGSSACAKPTPQTHPLLTRKINVLCNSLVKQRIKEFQRKVQHKQAADAKLLQNRPVMAREIVRPSVQSHPQVRPIYPTKHSQVGPKQMIIQVNKEPQPTISSQNLQMKSKQLAKPFLPPSNTIKTTARKATIPLRRNQIPSSVSPSNATLLRGLTKQDEYGNMKTNIEFRKVNNVDIDEIHQPELHREDHRWLVLDLYDDFSHIFVPDFRDLVSLDRIHKVMSFSRQKEKIVKLQFFQNAPFDAFVTPTSTRKIYFGPLKLNMRPPLLILLQSVDGTMMLREIYQQEHNIQCNKNGRTTAFWILQINGQTHFEIEAEPSVEEPLENGTVYSSGAEITGIELPEPNQESEIIDSDEDCMIVEDDLEDQRRLEGLGQPVAPIEISKTYGLSEFLKFRNTRTEGTDAFTLTPKNIEPTGSVPSVPRMHFTIQAKESTNDLQISPITNELPTTTTMDQSNNVMVPNSTISSLPSSDFRSTSQQSGFVQLLNLPPAAIITSVASAPKEAPYGSTIYISNVQSQSNNATAALPYVDISASEATTATVTEKPKQMNSSLDTSASKITSYITQDVQVVTTAKNGGSVPLKRRLGAFEKANAGLNNVHKMAKSSLTKSSNSIDKPQVKITKSAVSSIGSITITKLTDSTATAGRTSAIATTALDSSKSISISINDGATVVTPSVKTPQMSTLHNETAPARPTYITPDVQVISTAIGASSTDNLIKRRRLSVRCSDTANSETANIAMDAVLKLLPQQLDEVTGEFTDLTNTEILKELTKNSKSATESLTNLTSSTVSTIGRTTITKHSEVKLPNKVNRLPVRSRTDPYATGTVPVVYNVDFADSQDEPTASIVIKPSPPAAKPQIVVANTTPQYSYATTPTITTSAGSNTSQSGGTLKRTASGSLKSTRGVRVIPTAVSEHVTHTHLTPTSAMEKFKLSPMVIGPKNYRSVKTTPLNFKNPNMTSKTTSVKPQICKISTSDVPPVISTVTTGPITVTTAPKVTQVTSPKGTLRSAKTVSLKAASTTKTYHRHSLPPSTVVSGAYDATKSNTTSVQNQTVSNCRPNINVRPAVQMQQRYNKTAKINPKPPHSNESSNAAAIKSQPIKVSINGLSTKLQNSSAASGTHATSTQTSAKPSDIEYGFFWTKIGGMPKFVGKRIRDCYLVKVPTIGILQMSSVGSVGTYLNRHLLSLNNRFVSKLPTVWSFIPQERLNPKLLKGAVTAMPKDVGAKETASNSNQTSPIAKITYTTATEVVATVPPKNTAPKSISTTAKSVVNAVAAASTNVLTDTILIED